METISAPPRIKSPSKTTFKRHSSISRFSRPQLSGYELANQDELNQELLDDDDEDFEVSEPTLRMSSLEDRQV